MNSLCILLTDSYSINENLILKSYKYLKISKLQNIYFVGDKKLFSKVYKKFSKNKKFIFLNYPLTKKNFTKYLSNILKKSFDLFKKKKINYIINMPIDKKKFLNNKFPGFTEFFSYNFDKKKNENMLLFGKKFSVCPITTHTQIKYVEKLITKKKLISTINSIILFYEKYLKQKPQIVVLGLNPHASKDISGPSKDTNLIKPIINIFKKKKINILGPVSADTAFIKNNNKVFIGMYHDQVLIPFKTLNKFEGINITIGKGLIRLSPDHGVGADIKNKINKINNESFIKCIKFCEKYYA